MEINKCSENIQSLSLQINQLRINTDANNTTIESKLPEEEK